MKNWVWFTVLSYLSLHHFPNLNKKTRFRCYKAKQKNENALIFYVFSYLNALPLKILTFSDSDSVDKTIDFTDFDTGAQ